MATRIKEQMILQYNGRDVALDAIGANIKKQWKDAGRKVSNLAELDIYVKPEEGKAYYVINKTEEGCIDL